MKKFLGILKIIGLGSIATVVGYMCGWFIGETIWDDFIESD